jgi:hypothetical protein
MALWRDERARNGGLDEVPLGVPLGDAATGRLWLCGKHLVGPDAEAVLERTGASAIVCLNERYELASRYPGYVRWLELEGDDGRAVWFPVPDLHAPPVAEVRPLLADLGRRLDGGEGLVVHCGAGHGRAGTVAAALLMARGATVADALARIAAARPGAGPQSQIQLDLLHELGAGAAGEPDCAT